MNRENERENENGDLVKRKKNNFEYKRVKIILEKMRGDPPQYADEKNGQKEIKSTQLHTSSSRFTWLGFIWL